MASSETARVHLRVLGQEKTFELGFDVGPSTLVRMLDVARSLAAQALEATSAITGESPSCRGGCSVCCRHLVMLTVPEAFALGAAVVALPEPRRSVVAARFEETLHRAEAAGIFGPRGARHFRVAEYHGEAELAAEVARRYFALQSPCPLLEGDVCTLYDHRPLACREHNVSSDPALCTSFDHPERRAVPNLGVARAVATAASELTGVPGNGVPLPILLEWYAERKGTLEPEVDGVTALRALLGALGDVEERRANHDEAGDSLT